MKLLQVCNEDKATSWQRTEAFKNLGLNFNLLYHSIHNQKYPFFKKVLFSVFHRLGFALERMNENNRLIEDQIRNKYDIIFIEKCLSLRKNTLKRLKEINPNTILICYTLDDFKGKGNNSIYFKNCIPFYDLIATNKMHNLEAYRDLGAKNVYYFKNSYSTIVHRPIITSTEDQIFYGSDVSFIGTYEKERANLLMYLAENNIKLKVWGWSLDSITGKINHPNITNMERYAYQDEFAKVMCTSKICLNFLRKSNHDTETTRSIEIPACGAFMLAERTENQLKLFKEDKEAAYFDSREELLAKVKYFIKNDLERTSIASAGYQRCKKDDYSYENQLKQILKVAQG